MKELLFLILSICFVKWLGSQPPAKEIAQPRNGPVKAYYDSGEKQFSANMKNGRLHGAWQSWYRNGQLLDAGRFVKGIPDGSWLIYYENGKRRFTRSYSAEKRERFQQEKVRYHPRRISLAITRLYKEDRPEAEQYMEAINFFCIKKNCTRGEEEDVFQKIFFNGSDGHYHPPHEQAFLHGPYVNFFEDGALKDSGNYQNGLPEGIWTKYSMDRQHYWKGYYRHGKKHGEWKLFTSANQLLKVIRFREDSQLWSREFRKHEAGEIKEVPPAIIK